MRTTIEIPDELRAALLEMAARRGEKGFSGLVQEAIELYLEREALREERVSAALAAIGSLDEAEAAALEESVRKVRAHWR